MYECFRDPEGAAFWEFSLYELTLIYLTPYRYSDQPTCMPFPSAQCEYHFWIRSAGNVSISFLLWRGDRGHSVHCEGVQWDKSAGSSHTFSRNGRVEYYTGIFVIESGQKNVKDCCVRLRSFWAKSV